jgi:hypothetical protein
MLLALNLSLSKLSVQDDRASSVQSLFVLNDATSLDSKGPFGWASMRDGTGSSLMLGMSSSHLVFD